MTVSPLADMSRDIPAVDRWQPRHATISGFTIHHNAGVDSYGQATAPGREVSANYWITNAGTIIPNVDEDYRAFTSGMAGYPAGAESDHRNVTVEVSNSPEGVASGSWAISAAAQAALSRLIGDVFRRHNLGPVRRGAVGGVAVHQDFVPTACPGPYIMGRLGQIIADAETYRVGSKPINPAAKPPILGMENDMIIFYKHALGRNKPGWLVLGYTPNALFLFDQDSANEWHSRIGKETLIVGHDSFLNYLRAAGGTEAQIRRVSKG